MFGKSLLARVGGGVGGAGLAANKLLLNHNVLLLFEGAQVRGEVAVGELEQIFERVKTQKLVHHQHRHNAQPRLTLKSLIKPF